MKLRVFFHRYGNVAVGCGLSIRRLWPGGMLPVWKHFGLVLGWPIRFGLLKIHNRRCLYLGPLTIGWDRWR